MNLATLLPKNRWHISLRDHRHYNAYHSIPCEAHHNEDGLGYSCGSQAYTAQSLADLRAMTFVGHSLVS
jgi:hypothetical protein